LLRPVSNFHCRFSVSGQTKFMKPILLDKDKNAARGASGSARLLQTDYFYKMCFFQIKCAYSCPYFLQSLQNLTSKDVILKSQTLHLKKSVFWNRSKITFSNLDSRINAWRFVRPMLHSLRPCARTFLQPPQGHQGLRLSFCPQNIQVRGSKALSFLNDKKRRFRHGTRADHLHPLSCSPCHTKPPFALQLPKFLPGLGMFNMHT